MKAHQAGRMIAAAGVAVLGVAAGLAIGRFKRMGVKAHMALTGDWEKQLKSEHAATKKLLKEMADSEPNEGAKRLALLETVHQALTRHAVEEENIVYPALRRVAAPEAVEQLIAEHTEMKTLIRRLQELPAEDPLWAEGAQALKLLVTRHARREEKELFPMLYADQGPDNETMTKLVRHEGAQVMT